MTIIFLPDSHGSLIAVRVTGRLRDADYDGFKAELAARARDRQAAPLGDHG